MDGPGEPVEEVKTVEVPPNRGMIIVTFGTDDTLQVKYNDMKPWKFWAAGRMLETLGDQMAMQAQMEQMQRAQLVQSLAQAPGGLRGTRQ